MATNKAKKEPATPALPDPILTSLRIEGFKRIKNVSLSLANVNILVGANGSGKSSILQAVHLACSVMRQAKKVGKTPSTITTEHLDYLPSDQYETLGHQNNWGNNSTSPSTNVTLTFEASDGSLIDANCRMRAARNAGISTTGLIDPQLSKLRKKDSFFSAYIPGISGIPNREDRRSKKVLLKACSFGDSNVILRNALLELYELNSSNITLIETWIGEVIGPIKIIVKYNKDTDLYLTCEVVLNGQKKPIELVGTGYLQLIQLFCYVLLFSPSLLLIDEPDIHLYPEIQEKLVQSLGRIAVERGLKIILTTHSPFIVRGAPLEANVYWLKDGAEESHDRQMIEAALGWGAFGKSIIIASEDKDISMLRALVKQWPEIDRQVAFLPGSGYKNLLTPTQAEDLVKTLGGKFKVLIHRDRDSLTDDEVDLLKKLYEIKGAHIWFTEESEIEAYFCSAEFVGKQCNVSPDNVREKINDILLDNEAEIYEKFLLQRKAHREEVYKNGDIFPDDEDVWTSRKVFPLKGAKAKLIFKWLKKHFGGHYNEEKITEVLRLKSHDLAADLRVKLATLINLQ